MTGAACAIGGGADLTYFTAGAGYILGWAIATWGYYHTTGIGAGACSACCFATTR